MLKAELELLVDLQHDMLEKLEWSGSVGGPGNGFMDSGPPSFYVRACPICRGIDPSDHMKSVFNESSHGHKRSCKLMKLLKHA